MSTTEALHPMQPLYIDDQGVIRFRPNKLIQHLQKIGRISLNETAALGFPAEDEQQLAQLIGYSIDGYGSLSYVDDEAWERADAARAALAATSAPAERPATPEVEAERFIQAAISNSPKPLQELGRHLSDWLDEDKWATAERLLLAIATSVPSEPAAYARIENGAMLALWTPEQWARKPADADVSGVQPLYTRAPAAEVEERRELIVDAQLYQWLRSNRSQRDPDTGHEIDVFDEDGSLLYGDDLDWAIKRAIVAKSKEKAS